MCYTSTLLKYLTRYLQENLIYSKTAFSMIFSMKKGFIRTHSYVKLNLQSIGVLHVDSAQVFAEISSGKFNIYSKTAFFDDIFDEKRIFSERICKIEFPIKWCTTRRLCSSICRDIIRKLKIFKNSVFR